MLKHALPTPKQERWKYTNLNTLYKTDMDHGRAEIICGKAETGIAVKSPLRPVSDGLLDAHFAEVDQATIINIPAHTILETPLDLSIIGQGLCTPQILIHIGSGAQVAIVETQSGKGAYWKNQYIQIHVGSNARLTHYRLSNESAQGNRTEYIDIALDRDAQYQSFCVQKDADHSVSDTHVAMQQEGSNCILNQITLLAGQQLNDTRFLVHHQAPHTNSVQNVRTIVNDRGNGIFQGKVHVDAIAQKTDGSQSSKALLLSNTAQMNTKPELEIYADDVKCAHGATTGQIDKDQLFYLKSRGIPHDQAMAILVEAFCMEILEQIPDEDTRILFIQEVGKWLTA